MQQVRSNRDTFHDNLFVDASAHPRNELSALFNDYTNSQRQCKRKKKSKTIFFLQIKKIIRAFNL